MDRKLDSLYLEKKTDVSLHDRFSEVLLEQLTKRTVHFKNNQKSLVLRLRNIPRTPRAQVRNKGSVWTRIGWRRNWRRGVWNFRNKYQQRLGSPRTRFSPAFKNKFNPAPKTRFSPASKSKFGPALKTWFSPIPKSRFMSSPKSSLTPTRRFSFPFNRFAQSGVLKKKKPLGQTSRQFKGKPLQNRLSGRVNSAKAARGQQQRQTNKAVPTKKELDADLDAYMSKSKSHLDKQLDAYMSLSKSRLDAELDEYMAMAGQTSMWE